MNKVLVMISTYNGEKYLREQLESLINQEGIKVDILVRDDGSTDTTINILEEYREKCLLSYYVGNNLKSAKSFMDLLKKSSQYDFYAFCDQDDYWISDKLKIAVNIVEKTPNKPTLYCGRPRIVDEKLNSLENLDNRQEPIIPTTFANRLIVRNAPGCTFVFNNKLKEIINQFEPQYIEMHDCWVYQVCSVFNGKIYYDDDVHILYRQHKNNVIGITLNYWERQIKRLNGLRRKECIRSKTAIEMLMTLNPYLSQEQKDILSLICKYKRSIIARMKIILSPRFKTNSRRMNRNFKISIILGTF